MLGKDVVGIVDIGDLGGNVAAAERFLAVLAAPKRRRLLLLGDGHFRPFPRETAAGRAEFPRRAEPSRRRHALAILFIALVGWTAIVAINLLSDLRARRHRNDIEDNLTAREFPLEPGGSALAASAPDRLRQPRDIHE